MGPKPSSRLARLACPAMAVGTADDEGHVLRPAIEVAAQEIGKGFAGHGLAAFVKHDAEGP